MKYPKFAFLAAGLLALSAAFRLVAQDVTVGEPVWFRPEPAPDVLPQLKKRPRIDYPDEMRKTGEIGYVIIERYIDANNKGYFLEATGTHLPFQRMVEDSADLDMSVAKRGGQPVDAVVWMSAIFNPKSAAVKGSDATPRLLTVAPVAMPTDSTLKGLLPVVRMKLGLDATGAIIDTVPDGEVNQLVLTAIRASLKTWRFAPARQNGKPVAAEVIVSVLCQPLRNWTEKGREIPPKVLSQQSPDYPVAMWRYGLRGKVEIDFIVDPEGHVQEPIITSSDNPSFDEPALKALRQWKFQPGTRDGKPVKTKMRIPMNFQIDDMLDGGRKAFRLEGRNAQSKLPPELRYDTLPKIRSVRVPVFPYALRRDGVQGKASAAIMINERGRVGAVEILEADHPEFGRALAAAVENFTFDAALKDGKPVPYLVKLEQRFSSLDLPDDEGNELLQMEKKHPEQIIGANVLDTPLKPVSRRAPAFPVSVGAEVTTGEALVELLVDSDGRARLPRIVSATDEAFGYAAVQAAAAWWFEPPKSGGKPTVVRAQVPFKFAAKPPAPAAGDKE